MLDVQVAVRGVSSADENQLEALQLKLAALFGAEDPAVIFWPRESELGVQFQIKEEVLGELLKPEAGCIAA